MRLPGGVFSPYTGIPANLLFFDRSGPTTAVWYYEQPLPEGRKSYTKTAPMQFQEFSGCLEWWDHREENEHAWSVSANDLIATNFDLDVKNPRVKAEITHLPPEELTTAILEKEQRISEILSTVQFLLREQP